MTEIKVTIKKKTKYVYLLIPSKYILVILVVWRAGPFWVWGDGKGSKIKATQQYKKFEKN